MKNILLIVKSMLMLIFFINHSTVYSQSTAVGTCNSVSIVNFPYYQPVYAANYKPCNTCQSQCFTLMVSVPWEIPRLNWLIRINPNGSTTVVQGGSTGISGFNITFNNVSPGKYYVRSKIPIKRTTTECPNGFELKPLSLQSTGLFQGIMRSTFNPADFFDSNEVFVGASQPSDIQWSYIDGNGVVLVDHFFAIGEDVRINTAGTQNYTHWWLAIFELNGAERYKSTGWNFGAMPTEINLSTFWATWNFETMTSYRVQLAIANQCNIVWAEMSPPQPPDFFICPSFIGCRLVEDVGPITMYPNPTSGSFNLNNLPSDDVMVSVFDMSGRLVKNYLNTYDGSFDISDINNGIYLVRAVQGGEILYNGKLSVVH